MTFASEEVRHAFHALPTQTQYEWLHWDEQLASGAYELHVQAVENTPDHLQMSVRIDKKLKRSSLDPR